MESDIVEYLAYIRHELERIADALEKIEKNGAEIGTRVKQ